MSGWQDIANAPRDGTQLLVSAGVSPWLAMVVAEYRDGFWLTQPGDYVVRPTHWQHLPDAPTTLSTEGQGA